ncbi:MAG: hypothetical protein GTN78_10345 [Gemmatimonadales bacterium]|nr:hypothetical protein [Gemmatimonadales bacterium]NIR00583.1 hypothetical protein [Gemmatimonadales bacterium]
MRTTALAALATTLALVACTEASSVAPTDTPVFDVASPEVQWGAMETGTHSSAAVAKGFPCGVGPAGITTQSHATLSNSGKETLHCHGQMPAGTEPQKAVILRGVLCGLHFGGFTTNSKVEITPGGRVNLRCQTP